jgi:uncharacterized membrane protein HdeD (DUF308 family)
LTRSIPATKKSDPLYPNHPQLRRHVMIILGVVLLIIGFIAKIAIIWTIGIIAVVVGAVLAIAGGTGRAIGGRRHYY